MRSKNVLVVALVVAVLGASASALTVTTAESFGVRRSIGEMIDDLGGDSGTDKVLEIGTGGSIYISERIDQDAPFSLILNGGDFTGISDGQGYKFTDDVVTSGAAYIGVLDGTLDLAAIECRSDFDPGEGTIEIGANGTMLVGNNYAYLAPGAAHDGNKWNIGNMIASGDLYASAGLELFVTDLTGGAVQITAVPEPATLVLLGLGALVSRRRKRA